MTTLSPSPRKSLDRRDDARGQASWSLWMLALFAFAYMLTTFVGVYVVFPLLGLQEGDVYLFAHSVAGWLAALASWLVLAAAPVAGVMFAVRALRLEVANRARLGLVLNALALLFTAYLVFDEIRMAYFPGFTFPFPG